ncbi:hypothetical protein L596_001226 [Steinernema carpocapsae]|uniref:Uncharacterized protein n=1 Tax=Steinernema carpocapsae TaxID=34508 RepID=A0A4U8UKV6_STECR|nr:hypothetical protein L596_001226 [Steinernema carpocapsae]
MFRGVRNSPTFSPRFNTPIERRFSFIYSPARLHKAKRTTKSSTRPSNADRTSVCVRLGVLRVLNQKSKNLKNSF